jgi:hypothetical protein
MPEPKRTPAWQRAFGAARDWMMSAIERGISFNEFQEMAQEQGFSYQRARMVEDWRSIQGLWKWEWHLDRLRDDVVIPNRYITDEFYARNYNSLAAVQYDYYDRVEQAWKTGFRMIDSEELLTKGEYLERARELYAPGGRYEDPTATGFRIRYIAGREQNV